MARVLYPLSLDLHGKSVLVIGGGPVGARKLAELIRCGADVTLIDPAPGPAVERLAGTLRMERRPFRRGDEKGRYLVFACAGDAEVNREAARLCREGSILCNVADAAQEGSFHVPGVIRQGDVTVTVGTGGAAPGLTRHLKRVLSEALGPEVAGLSAVLGRFRDGLRGRFDAAAARGILEGLPYRRLLDEMKTAGAAAVEALLAAEADPRTGTGGPAPVKIHPVVLAGAGPGHPRLLTLMAAEALRRAEVIVHDRLIPE